MYIASEKRYEQMTYKRSGNSGLKLPLLSLGLWHNFGGQASPQNMAEMLKYSFDNGITHFDLANNYGPPAGSAEENFGNILHSDFKNYRDELVISTKAGYYMWAGPYGEWGSKKYLVSSLDQSLQRMKLNYVDIFYHHRPDPNTPIEETANALDLLVRQGKTLYVGISSYNPEQTKAISKIFKELKTPFIIHQPSYSMLDRWIEGGLTDVLKTEGIGAICFCPLAQGMLTDRYFEGIPKDSRAKTSVFLNSQTVEKNLPKTRALAIIAAERGQSLSQLAISWILRLPEITSVLIGASRVSQIEENLGALKNLSFTKEELDRIDGILKG